jgi:hypothetical protein
VDLFYDVDNNFNNGFTTIADDLVVQSATSQPYPWPSNVAEGTYRVGAAVRDGINPVVFTYATGSIRVVRTSTLTVSEPNSDLPIAPSSPTGIPVTVPVRWTTNVPPGAGRFVDVYAQTIDAGGLPSGPLIEVMPRRPLSVTSTTFSSTTPGIFGIYVRLTLEDSGPEVLVTPSPKPVRVSSLPRILWVGTLAEDEPDFEGAIFQGHNFEDNAGTAMTTVGDLDDDGLDDFAISARYGKPFFRNPSGVGHGEAYIIYGASGANKTIGEHNLNSVGLTSLRGVTLLGIPTVGDTDDTDGLSAITLIPDVDGDGKGEIVFGFPSTDSQGGQFGPLESSRQCLNGCIVILSSNNSVLRDPDVGEQVIELSAVGQSFTNTTVNPPPPTTLADRRRFDAMQNSCVDGTDGVLDTIIGPGFGFVSLLAPPSYQQAGFEVIPPTVSPGPNRCPTQFDLPASCASNGQIVLNDFEPGSGFYPNGSVSLEPRGARIIGKSQGDALGTSLTVSIPVGRQGPGNLIISAPRRSATSNEIDGLSGTLASAGVAYLIDNVLRWQDGDAARPFQFVVGTESHCGGVTTPSAISTEIAGKAGDAIQNVLGIDDFNRDGRNDIAVGAPNADGGKGRVYVAFRRDTAIEGDFLLMKLELAPNNLERLTGVLITTQSNDAFGSSMASGVDFNFDGISDLVIGSPNASNQIGEIIVVFGDPNLVSPENGVTVQTLLSTRDSRGRPRAVRINGNPLDMTGRFGFNVANGGDVDGDGRNDLLVSAPNGSPRFDRNPSDATDSLSEPGLDRNFDGRADDVTGPFGLPDGRNDNDALQNAGIVYVISSRNRLDLIPPTMSGDISINIDRLGTSQLRGFMIVGRRAGDRMGGGDAGDVSENGVATKLGRGRSRGLASAGDVDGDGQADVLIGSILADPLVDPTTGVGVQNGGEAYLIYGNSAP